MTELQLEFQQFTFDGAVLEVFEVHKASTRYHVRFIQDIGIEVDRNNHKNLRWTLINSSQHRSAYIPDEAIPQAEAFVSAVLAVMG